MTHGQEPWIFWEVRKAEMQVMLALSSCGEIIGQSGLKDVGASRTLNVIIWD